MRWIQILMAALIGGIAMLAFTHSLAMLVPDSFMIALITAAGVGVVAYANTPRRPTA